MTNNELLQFEISKFKNDIGRNIAFNEINEENVKQALSKALNDTLAMAPRRYKTTYKEIEEKLLKEFINDFIDFSTKNIITNDENFDIFFKKLTKKFMDKMRHFNKQCFAKFGFAQKFVSISFKYMYCFEKSNKDNFLYCKLPLDKYTINWYSKCGDKSIIKEFKKNQFSWSEIEEELYDRIQCDITNILKNKKSYTIDNKGTTIELPCNKLEVEFIVWSQERLYEVSKTIEKYKDYFNRLGITYTNGI